MMQKRTLTGLIFLLILGFASPLWAQSGASVQYVYDALGRLTTVVDPSGNVATYNYDAVGNLLSITKSALPSTSAPAILGFTPAQGPIGQTVAIRGQNFSPTPSANTVQFRGHGNRGHNKKPDRDGTDRRDHRADKRDGRDGLVRHTL